MSTSIEKIIGGLGEKENPDAGLDALNLFKSGPKDLNELTLLAAESGLVLERQRQLLDRVGKEIARRSAEITAEWEAQTDLDRHMRRKLAQDAIQKYRFNVLKTTESERLAIQRELATFEARAMAVADLWQSPAHLLAREGLGTDERSRYQSQLANSGPAEVRAMAQHAVSTSNRILGAVVMARLDAMTQNQREQVGVKRADLAMSLMADKFAMAQESFRLATNNFQSAVNRNRAFESGKRNAFSTIELGLARRAETGVLRPKEGE